MTEPTGVVKRVARALRRCYASHLAEMHPEQPNETNARIAQAFDAERYACSAIEAAHVEELRDMLRQYIEVTEAYGNWSAAFLYVHGMEWEGPFVDAIAAKRLLGIEADDAALGKPSA